MGENIGDALAKLLVGGAVKSQEQYQEKLNNGLMLF